MKTTLTIEQSAELIKRGVSKDKASDALIYLDYAGEEVEPHKVFKREGDGVLLTRLRNGTVIGVEAKMVHKDSDCKYSESIFTLSDLLSILPKEITVTMEFYDVDRLACLHISSTTEKWYVSYKYEFEEREYWCKMFNSEELIDALYKLLLWDINHNHIKLD